VEPCGDRPGQPPWDVVARHTGAVRDLDQVEGEVVGGGAGRVGLAGQRLGQSQLLGPDGGPPAGRRGTVERGEDGVGVADEQVGDEHHRLRQADPAPLTVDAVDVERDELTTGLDPERVAEDVVDLVLGDLRREGDPQVDLRRLQRPDLDGAQRHLPAALRVADGQVAVVERGLGDDDPVVLPQHGAGPEHPDRPVRSGFGAEGDRLEPAFGDLDDGRSMTGVEASALDHLDVLVAAQAGDVLVGPDRRHRDAHAPEVGGLLVVAREVERPEHVVVRPQSGQGDVLSGQGRRRRDDGPAQGAEPASPEQPEEEGDAQLAGRLGRVAEVAGQGHQVGDVARRQRGEERVGRPAEDRAHRRRVSPDQPGVPEFGDARRTGEGVGAVRPAVLADGRKHQPVGELQRGDVGGGVGGAETPGRGRGARREGIGGESRLQPGPVEQPGDGERDAVDVDRPVGEHVEGEPAGRRCGRAHRKGVDRLVLGLVLLERGLGDVLRR